MPSFETGSIEPISSHGFREFAAYLHDHVSDNGSGDTPYFQPMARGGMSADRIDAFRKGLQVEVGEPGWRRIWGMRSENGRIIGHVDLRARPEQFAGHRCLLGMGVDRHHRRLGLGVRLIAHAENWARTSGQLEWIDLQVLSSNDAALRLYRRTGFVETGEIQDMFRIDGLSFAYTYMSKKL